MSTLFARNSRSGIFQALFVSGLLVLLISGASQAAPGNENADDLRSSVSRHIVTGGRENIASARNTFEEHEALVTAGSRATSKTRGGFAKPGAGPGVTLKSANDFWFFDADVVLFNDDDNDGYFHGIDLLFDADTIYAAVEVYAVVYLSHDFGPWNEYGITDDFWIFGASGDDEYVLVTELMSGYPTGDYDLLIELFDAQDNSFLASIGPDETSELSFLPLEDFGRDEPIAEIPVAVSHGGGASGGWTIGFLLLMLVVSAVRKIWRRRNDALVRIDSPAPCWEVRRDSRFQGW